MLARELTLAADMESQSLSPITCVVGGDATAIAASLIAVFLALQTTLLFSGLYVSSYYLIYKDVAGLVRRFHSLF